MRRGVALAIGYAIQGGSALVTAAALALAIVGALLWVGRGKIDPLTFEKIVATNDRAMAGPSAPANGLCLIAVEYGETRERRELDEADE